MDVGSLLPPRSVEDILAERVRLVIGGQDYRLPVPVIAVAEEWKASLDLTMTGLLVDTAEDDPGAVMDALATDSGPFLDLLASFDTLGLLPDRESIRQSTTPLGLLCAVLEVWRAVNPLVDIGLDAWAMTTDSRAHRGRPTNGSRRNTAGPIGASAPN